MLTAQKIMTEVSVSWRLDDINIDASLTMPAGSGPTDRNWNAPLLSGTNGSAALLAQMLTELG